MWKRLREAQLALQPLCEFCLQTEEITAAEVVDHIRPHRGQVDLFHDPLNLQSLCKAHHDGTKQRIERGSVDTRLDATGWPEWREGR